MVSVVPLICTLPCCPDALRSAIGSEYKVLSFVIIIIQNLTGVTVCLPVISPMP